MVVLVALLELAEPVVFPFKLGVEQVIGMLDGAAQDVLQFLVRILCYGGKLEALEALCPLLNILEADEILYVNGIKFNRGVWGGWATLKERFD